MIGEVEVADVELARALEQRTLGDRGFPHASHLRVAWVYLHESDSLEHAAQKMCATLREFTAAVGAADKFHHTITLFWMRMLSILRDSPTREGIEGLFASYPQLLDKDFILRFYSRDFLFSDRARTVWIEPDLKPFPDHAAAIRSPNSTRHPSHRTVPG